MKIAVTYENGEIFQHFGHTETFKVYEVEDGRILGSEIIGSNGSGHGALAKLLNEQGIDVLICGGIGGGAHNTGANCEHHHGEDHSCGDHGCGDHGCGDHDCGEHDCGQGCHGGKQGKNSGKRVRTHYRGTFNDGTQFDSSYDRGDPLEFICGAGQMIPGFDAAVADMDVGQIIDVHLSPAEAYGEVNPDAIFTVEIARVPGAESVFVGQQVYLQDSYGRPFPVKIAAKDDSTITFDANHEMAGKELNFRIELVEVAEA